MYSPAFFPGWGVGNFIPPTQKGALETSITESEKSEHGSKTPERDSGSGSTSDHSDKKSNEDLNESETSSISDIEEKSDSEDQDDIKNVDTTKMDPTHREILEKLKRQEREEREEIQRELQAHKEALARHEQLRKAQEQHFRDLRDKELVAAQVAIAAAAAKKLSSPNSSDELRHKKTLLSPADLKDRQGLDYLNAFYMERAFAAAQVGSPSSEDASEQSHHWTFEEQFKQLYELSDDPKRKEFLDDLFAYMQKRGTPVNRIPIMAKQTLDLYQLFKLVVSKGGLVEVINKKLWREITKGLNLPSSITSAAFTLRTQYMKYLYPYECDKLKLSSPAELQAAIDGNRREGRRPSYGYEMSPGAPSLVSPHLNGGFFNGLTAMNGHMNGHLNGFHPESLREKPAVGTSSDDDQTPPASPNHHAERRQLLAKMQATSRAMEEASKRLESRSSGEEPPKKRSIPALSEEERLLAHACLPSAHLKLTSRADGRTEAENSLVVSMEINGIMYQGVLFSQLKPTT